MVTLSELYPSGSGGGITYPINSVRSPFSNGDFLYWLERGKNFANTNSPVGVELLYTAASNGQLPEMRFNNTMTQLNNSASFSFTQDRGVSFWFFNNGSLNSYQSPLNKYLSTSSGQEWTFFYVNNSGDSNHQKIGFYLLNSSASVILNIAASASLEVYEHWVLNYDHTTTLFTLYKNGISVASGTPSGTPATFSGNVHMGGVVSSSSNFINGRIS